MNEPIEQDIEVHVLTSSQDLDDYDVLALRNISAAVPHKTSDSFRKLIWAAMVTYAFGNKSIDYTLRRYDWLWEKFKPHARETNPQFLALRAMMVYVDHASSALEKAEAPTSSGQICAKYALCRLEATFKAAYGLVRKEYIFETDAIVRLILEQLAWACAVKDASDNEMQQLLPTKCISHLKTHFPEAGRLYGELSEGAHIDPSIARNYLRFHADGMPVVRRSTPDATGSGERLLELSIVYINVVQALFKPLEDVRFNQMVSELKSLRERY